MISSRIKVLVGIIAAFLLAMTALLYWFGRPSADILGTDLNPVIALAVGSTHRLILRQDGTVLAWGNNSVGQLGDGTTTNRLTPVQVSGLTGITKIVPSGYSNFALKFDGTVWAWGWNDSGQLGDGTTTNRLTPVQVSGLTGITKIVRYKNSIFALKFDGTIWLWGGRSTPVQVSGLTGITKIVRYTNSNFALKSDGTVWGWGDNSTDYLTPVQVSGLTGITEIVVNSSNFFSSIFALKSDGTVWAWGDNQYGQLGDGTETNRSTPVQVSNLTSVSKILDVNRYGSFEFSIFVLKSDGTVWAWGSNYDGRLGDGTTTDRRTPVQVSGLDKVIKIAAAETNAIFALKSDGTVWAWGNNQHGQLGDGTKTNRSTPAQVANLSSVSQITTRSLTSFALKSDGTVWVWGGHSVDWPSDGTTTYRSTPVQVSGLTGTTKIVLSYDF